MFEPKTLFRNTKHFKAELLIKGHILSVSPFQVFLWLMKIVSICIFNSFSVQILQ